MFVRIVNTLNKERILSSQSDKSPYKNDQKDVSRQFTKEEINTCN